MNRLAGKDCGRKIDDEKRITKEVNRACKKIGVVVVTVVPGPHISHLTL
jgi:hypothetical protein